MATNMYINALTALWNNAGTSYTAIKMTVTDSGSLAGSKLLDLFLGSVSKFSVDKAGNTEAAGNLKTLGNVEVGGTVLPLVANTVPLGSPTLPWSDLFLGEGAVISFNNYNSTLEHFPGILQFGNSDIRVSTYGTDPTSVVTVAGSQTLTNKTISGGIISSAEFSTTDDTATIGGTVADSQATLGRTVTTGATLLLGGTTTGSGAYFQAFGSGHSTNGGDIVFGTNNVAKYQFDYSANTHAWYNNAGSQLATLNSAGVLNSAGNLSTSANVTSAGGHFVGPAAHAVLGNASGAGTIYLRPNGYNNNTNETTIGTAGDMYVSGSVTAEVNVSCQDFYSIRGGGTTGVIFFGNQFSGPGGTGKSAYLHYDGASYVMPSAALYVGGAVSSGSGGIVANNGNISMSSTANYLSMVDLDGGGAGVAHTRHIHHNSGNIGFLNSGGGWLAYGNDSGEWHATGALTTAGSIEGRGGTVTVKSPNYAAQNIHFWMRGPANEDRAVLYTRGDTGSDLWIRSRGGRAIAIGSDGCIDMAGLCERNGVNGTSGTNKYNFQWSLKAAANRLSAWVDVSDLGYITFTSDYRAKRNVERLSSQWDKVKALRPIRFQWKDWSEQWVDANGEQQSTSLSTDGEEEEWGFLAHELQETLIPTAASGVKDQKNTVQSPNPWAVISALTTVIQEMQTRIEQLEARAA